MSQVDEAIAAEVRLLDPAVRADAAAVDELLAADFGEIGQGGRIWSRDATIRALSEAPAVPAEATNFTGRLVAPDLVLVTYTTVGPAGSIRRASLWRGGPNGWQVVFHQGTRVL